MISPIEVVLHRLEELEERCKALEQLCLNLQKSLDALRFQKDTKKINPEVNEKLDQKLFSDSPLRSHQETKKFQDVTRHLKKGEIDKALALLDYFIQQKDHQFKVHALYYKGLIFMHKKEYAQAEALFSSAYLCFKNQALCEKPIIKQCEKKKLFPIQILLKSAECLCHLGKKSEATFVCEEIKRNLQKVSDQYRVKIIKKLKSIESYLK
ncbi:tetratricopeptide repeat protein [Holospora obtusa]|uniref:tetratricopeptide repeat protein n=1 Tax=Holospora obtusa TaxID=49893 RepID=UPI0012EC1E19|nr:tetratricopeptide repeat protein [Holospora obtusa]